MDGSIGSSSSSDSSSTTVASSKQLHRRLNGLGRTQWSFKADFDLLTHLGSINSTDSLLHLDILSDCIFRMAEHVNSITDSNELKELMDAMLLHYNYLALCKTLAWALQQLAEGVQQYLQQGQLPAALTERALDALHELCQLHFHACQWFMLPAYHSKDDEKRMRQRCYDWELEGGALCNEG
jgi:hypothetical protein